MAILFLGVGIAHGIIEDPILGEDTHSFAVQLNEHQTTTCINTKNRIQVKKTSQEMTNSNVGVLLNLDERLLNIYFNGKNMNDYQGPVPRKLDNFILGINMSLYSIKKLSLG